MFVKCAGQFDSKIEVVKDSIRADGKSILSALTLVAEAGSELLIEATGHDAAEALAALVELVETGFVEKEPADPQPRHAEAAGATRADLEAPETTEADTDVADTE
jgi:phosphocarrier protein